MDDIWDNYKRYVYKIALKYKNLAEFDDLIQEGYIALHQAALTYDDTKGAFITYATYRINGHLCRYISLNKSVHIPVWVTSVFLKYNKYRERYKDQKGKYPTDKEVIKALNLDITEKELEKVKKAMNTKSLYSPIATEEGEINLLDTIPDEKADLEGYVLDKIENEQLKTVLDEIMQTLTPEQQIVLNARYKDRLTYKEIQEQYNFTTNKSVRVERSAFRIFMKASNRNKLQQFADEILYNRAIHGTLSNFNITWTSATEKIAIQEIERKKAL